MILQKNNRPSLAGWKITFNCLSLTENLDRYVQSLLYAYDIVIICMKIVLPSAFLITASDSCNGRIKALPVWSGLLCC